MKKTVLTLALFASASVFAQSQAEITRRAYENVERQSKKLDKIIERKCSQAESVKEWGNGSGASAAYAACLADVTIKLQKAALAMKVK